MPSTLYFLVGTGGRVLGAIHHRHELTEALSLHGGHIGYGVRPSERRRGRASLMLALLLDSLRGAEPSRVLLTCDDDNPGSFRTIEGRGGRLEDRIPFEGRLSRRYWIEVPERGLRQAGPGDEERILALYRAATEKGRRDGSSCWTEDYPDREILREDLAGGELSVLEEGGRLLAAITVLRGEVEEYAALPWTPGRACVPVRLCVAPGEQGRGLGEKVMRLASARAKAEGFEFTRHLAAVGNAAANRLYARMGYRRFGPVEMYGTSFHAYELRL